MMSGSLKLIISSVVMKQSKLANASVEQLVDKKTLVQSSLYTLLVISLLLLAIAIYDFVTKGHLSMTALMSILLLLAVGIHSKRLKSINKELETRRFYK